MVPRWLERRYEILWRHLQASPFRFEDAANILKEENKDSEDQVKRISLRTKKKGLA